MFRDMCQDLLKRQSNQGQYFAKIILFYHEFLNSPVYIQEKQKECMNNNKKFFALQKQGLKYAYLQ